MSSGIHLLNTYYVSSTGLDAEVKEKQVKIPTVRELTFSQRQQTQHGQSQYQVMKKIIGNLWEPGDRARNPALH